MNLLCTLLTIGLPAIDESLDKLLVAMESFPNVAVLGDAVGLARVIGLCLALCVGSYECWMMMLGRRGMDVMKLLRIIGISLCISRSEEHTSELQSRQYLVCRLLLEKKKQHPKQVATPTLLNLTDYHLLY